MSIRSWPEVQGTSGTGDLASGFQDDKCARSEYGISGTSSGNKFGKGRRLKVDNKRRDLDGDKAEKGRALYMSRTGYISSLTRIRREVELLMNESGKWVDIEKKLTSYHRVWRDFVNTHDKYVHLLDNEFDCELAFDVYEVQIHKSVEFEAMVNSWSAEVKRKEEVDLVSQTNSRSVRSKVSSSSSKLSTLSKKREMLAHAQLKIEQVAKQHEIAKKMLELRNESELLEAQMKREEAMVSLNIFEEQSETGRSLSNLFYPAKENTELTDKNVSRGWGQNVSSDMNQFDRSAADLVFSNVQANPSVVSVVKGPVPTAVKLKTPVFYGSSISRPDTVSGSVPKMNSDMYVQVQSSTGVLPSGFPSVSARPPLDTFVGENSSPTVMFESRPKSYEVNSSVFPTIYSVYSRDGDIHEQGQNRPDAVHSVVSSVCSRPPVDSVVQESSLPAVTLSTPIVQGRAPSRSVIEDNILPPTRVSSGNCNMGQHGVSNQNSSYHTQLWNPTWGPQMNTSISNSPSQQPGVQTTDTSMEIVKALRQVVATPKIEYMHFDGNPIKFTSFMHNFETCLEKNNDNDASKLQLLIQHCHGKAKEAIESCVNLSAEEGYRVAKETLSENFGKPHIIARAHIKKLVDLPNLKKADGSSLLEFARHLDSTNRTLKGMGPEYVSDLNHMNTLRELNKKLPIFMRAKWTEDAGKIFESGSRPKFEDFLKFIKKKATLMNNEFGDDLSASGIKDGDKGKFNGRDNGRSRDKVSLAVGTGKELNGQSKNPSRNDDDKQKTWQRGCSLCMGSHGIWKCNKFQALSQPERKKVVSEKALCFKCLGAGHHVRTCLKKHFRCQIQDCGKEHHTLLHPQQTTESKPDDQDASEVKLGCKEQQGVGGNSNAKERGSKLSAATGAGESRVCLGVIPVKIGTKDGKGKFETYALLDSGSEVTLCHEQLLTKLEICGKKLNFTLTGMTGSQNVESQVVDIVVESMDGSTSVELENVRTVRNIPISEGCIPKREDLENWHHFGNIDLHEAEDRDVMLIIGLKENPQLFLPLDYRVGGQNEPVAVRYSLGWTIMGPVSSGKESEHCSVNLLETTPSRKQTCQGGREFEVTTKANILNIMDQRRTDNEMSEQVIAAEDEDDRSKDQDCLLKKQLERLWKTDFGGSVVETKPCQSVEDKKALEIMERSLKKVNGHFQVALPWKSYPPSLPNNRVMAERRCQLLKRRLLKDEDLLLKYRTTMSDYIEKGHAERVPAEELNPKINPVWYLPHHPVVHPLKPEKVRVVYDCAAKYKQVSLNEQLLQGPDEANHLVGVLSRFRQESVGLVADIEAMFHQVLVEPSDCDVLRFLWWPDGDLSKDLVEYRMVKHLFGAKSSPSIANFCLKKTADLEKEGIDPEAVETVKKNMYVDDLMKSTDTTQKAINLVGQLRELLSRGGFRLTKWYSNRREVIAAIPESERAKSVANLEIEQLPTESALGMKWNIEEDKFVWDISDERLAAVNSKPSTRRGVLSVIYSVFDPLGFIAPYTMKAKLLLQLLCRRRLGWDDQLGEEERCQWTRWIEDLPKLAEVKVSRCFKPETFDEVKRRELHLFSDASRLGYSAVAYLRSVDVSGRIHVAFVMGKARLAPLREISIPRLELTAAVVSVKLRAVIREEIDLPVGRVYYWTDSTSVLKCINNESKRFHTFESNRLTIIHSESSPREWRYVNRDVNPADDGSKGLKLEALLKDDRWISGPQFLWKDESFWPKLVEIPQLRDEDPEVRKEAQIYVTVVNENVLEKVICYHSSWWKLRRCVAWLLRYKQYLRGKLEETSCYLKLDDIRKAEREIIRHVQLTAFPEVVKILSSTKGDMSNMSGRKSIQKAGLSIRKLNPQLKDGLLIVGGRLVHAPVDENIKHPVILPYKHHVTDLVVQSYHQDVGHMGQESVLSSLRSKFWIVKGRTAVRRTIRMCKECARRNARPGEQFMANLPRDRITPSKPPFTYVGIDYFGPFEIKQGRSRVKRYGCLFTCLVIRAVHVEIAHSLDTDSMINALRRFISIRGRPEEIRSDQGTNFTSANKEMKQAVRNLDEHKINKFCLQREIKWVFNPPAASHMGGVWERMIRSIRQVLKATLKEQLVNDEVLSTVMAEAVHIINSRPLSRNSDSHLDDQPLTANHLLHLRPSSSVPPGIFDKSDLFCRRAWKQAQYLANVFWRRWTREYLPTLLERKKWNTKKRNLRVGDVVLISDENYPRGTWPLARVVEVIAGRDGLVRSAKVKTTSTVATRSKRRRREELNTSTVILTRPIAKLCLLEMDEDAEDK